jgi:enoyl-CoA hydratase/carnithine racemase
VNGAALGGGFGLVAQGHVVLAAEDASFGLPEVRIGLWPFFIYRSVESAIGARNALYASLTGHAFKAQQALQWGLVHQLWPANELAEQSMSMATQLAMASPAAIVAGLEYVRRTRELSTVEAGKVASEFRSRLMASSDFKEGIAAFKQKRAPLWPSMPSAFYEEH